MKSAALASLLALVLSCVTRIGAAADISITRVPQGMPISIYADGNGAHKLTDLAPVAFSGKLPLPVLNENDGFFQVAIDGQRVWIDSEQVTVSRGVKIDCNAVRAAMSTGQTADAGASRGAGPKSNPCASVK